MQPPFDEDNFNYPEADAQPSSQTNPLEAIRQLNVARSKTESEPAPMDDNSLDRYSRRCLIFQGVAFFMLLAIYVCSQIAESPDYKITNPRALAGLLMLPLIIFARPLQKEWERKDRYRRRPLGAARLLLPWSPVIIIGLAAVVYNIAEKSSSQRADTARFQESWAHVVNACRDGNCSELATNLDSALHIYNEQVRMHPSQSDKLQKLKADSERNLQSAIEANWPLLSDSALRNQASFTSFQSALSDCHLMELVSRLKVQQVSKLEEITHRGVLVEFEGVESESERGMQSHGVRDEIVQALASRFTGITWYSVWPLDPASRPAMVPKLTLRIGTENMEFHSSRQDTYLVPTQSAMDCRWTVDDKFKCPFANQVVATDVIAIIDNGNLTYMDAIALSHKNGTQIARQLIARLKP